jgi:hypothetical protein
MNDYNTTSLNIRELNARVYRFEYKDLSKHVHRDADGRRWFAWYGRTEIDENAKLWVDYKTLADAVGSMIDADELIKRTAGVVGEWEQVSGYDPDLFRAYIEDHPEEFPTFEDEGARAEWLDDNYPDYYEDVFITFLVDEQGAKLLKQAAEIVYYNAALDLYAWGVTHCGTAWRLVPTEIEIPTLLTA